MGIKLTSAVKVHGGEVGVRAKTRRDNFRGGERVSFEDRSGQSQVGTIARVNRQTATIHTDDGKVWRVSFSLLRHIIDV